VTVEANQPIEDEKGQQMAQTFYTALLLLSSSSSSSLTTGSLSPGTSPHELTVLSRLLLSSSSSSSSLACYKIMGRTRDKVA
jgi:hypothetical protein